MPLPKTTRFFAFFLILLSLTSCDLLLGPMLDGAGQSPDQIEGLSLWLRADKGVYEDFCGGKPSENNMGVQCWEDQSGNNNHATSGTPPSWQKSGPLNGKPSVYFSGSSFLNGSLSGISAPTIISVSYIPAMAQNGIIFFNILGADIKQIADGMDQNYVFSVGSNFIPSSPSIGKLVIFSTLIAGEKATAYINGKLRGSQIVSIPPVSTSYDIGNNTSFDGHIAEILVYNRPLSDSERQDVESYLGKKYGIDPAE